MRMLAGSVVTLMLSACSSAALLQDQQTNRYNVDGRLLKPESGGGSAAVQAYTLSPSESFRMPRPQQAPAPELPAGMLRHGLQATTVCVQVILDASGHVQRSELLLTHSACSDGADAIAQALVLAAREATAKWTFEPAALCHFAAGVTPVAADDCTGATRIEPVPVTLAYAFTFEVIEGKAVVRSQTGLR